MDEYLKRTWANNVKQGRVRKQMSQQALAEACGVDQSTISRWERGEAVPSEDNKMAIADAFGLEDPRSIFPLRVARTGRAEAAVH